MRSETVLPFPRTRSSLFDAHSCSPLASLRIPEPKFRLRRPSLPLKGRDFVPGAPNGAWGGVLARCRPWTAQMSKRSRAARKPAPERPRIRSARSLGHRPRLRAISASPRPRAVALWGARQAWSSQGSPWHGVPSNGLPLSIRGRAEPASRPHRSHHSAFNLQPTALSCHIRGFSPILLCATASRERYNPMKHGLVRRPRDRP